VRQWTKETALRLSQEFARKGGDDPAEANRREMELYYRRDRSVVLGA